MASIGLVSVDTDLVKVDRKFFPFVVGVVGIASNFNTPCYYPFMFDQNLGFTTLELV